jgi:hypothetical protein
MTREIKIIAEEFGFSPKRFGCHGVQVGGASLLRAAGASDSLILLIGRWVSLPACLGYQEASTATHDKLLQVLLTRGLYTAHVMCVYATLSHDARRGVLSTPRIQKNREAITEQSEKENFQRK